MSGDLELLRADLERLGASQFQTATFEADPRRARSAIAKAMAAGAERPISYALAVFNRERIEHKPPQRLSNLHGNVDPLYTDDGERIWQWYEVDDEWRRGYLRDCWKALEEEREPAARYRPSEQEFDDVYALMGKVVPDTANMRESSQAALRAWSMLWFGEPEVRA